MSREFFGGWETRNLAAEGFVFGGTASISTSAWAHKDRLGFGGTTCISGNASGLVNPPRNRLQQNAHVRPLVEGWDRDMFRVDAGGLGAHGYVHAFNAGVTELGSVRLHLSAGTISIYVGESTLVMTSDPGVFPYDRYFVLAYHFRILDSGGLYEVYVDDQLVLSYEGDTKPGAEAMCDTFAFGIVHSVFDEYCRNSITMEYDGGTGGVPVAGETITGGTSGATAVITTVEGDATSGVLVLQQWNDVDFLNDEALTSPSMAALVNAPDDTYISGFQPNSTRPGTGFVVPFKPTGVGATTQLVSSTGAANWTTVDEVPPNTTDYNFSGTNGQYDTYVTSDTLPASAVSVIAVSGYIYALRDGTVINNAGFVIRLSGTDYPSEQSAPLATDHAAGWFNFNVSPLTRSQWTVAELNGGVEFGPQVRI